MACNKYLVKKSNNDHRKSCKNDIVQRLEPVIIKSLTREASLKGEPKLSQCKCKVLVEEVSDHLQFEPSKVLLLVIIMNLNSQVEPMKQSVPYIT